MAAYKARLFGAFEILFHVPENVSEMDTLF